MRKTLENMAIHVACIALLKEDVPTGLRFSLGGFWRVKHRSGRAEIFNSLEKVEEYLDAKFRQFNG